MAKKKDGRHSSRGNPRRKVTHAEAYGAVQLEFLQILKVNETATADAIHERLQIPDSALMKIGPAIRELAKDGRIVRVGYLNTGRSKAHGRTLKVWKLAD
ncbi:MAG: hypothetical protein RIK87_24730 [Fuerstiella sp.]